MEGGNRWDLIGDRRRLKGEEERWSEGGLYLKGVACLWISVLLGSFLLLAWGSLQMFRGLLSRYILPFLQSSGSG